MVYKVQYFKPLQTDRPSTRDMAALEYVDGASEDMRSPVGSTSTSSDEELIKPIFENGRYRNPWETWKDISVANFLYSLVKTKNESDVPSKEVIICEYVCLVQIFIVFLIFHLLTFFICVLGTSGF